MKRATAIAAVFILLITAFTSCKNKAINEEIITDYEGNEHTLVLNDGEYVQDENGNLIEKYTNENGEELTNPVTFPNVINKNDYIENAFFKLKIPEGWKFDDTIRAFRIQHDGECTKSGAVCEVYVEINKSGDVEDDYATKLARDNGIAFLGSDMVSDVKEFEANLFGRDCKAFSSRYNDNCTHYCYVFGYSYASIAIQMLIKDECKEDDFKPEEFLEENFTLKEIG